MVTLSEAPLGIGGAEHWLSLARHTPLAIVSDLDGTLVPFASTPAQAVVSDRLAELLRKLASAPGVRLAVASGRTRESLEGALGRIPGLLLVAEHGGWKRADGAWQPCIEPDLGPLSTLSDALAAIAARYRGAWIERKTWSLAVHSRPVRRSERAGLLVEAAAQMDAWLAGKPGFERLNGADLVEVRPSRVRKSLAISWMKDRAPHGERMVALGDDVTDEDLFRALGPADEAVLVGERGRATAARWTLPDAEATLSFMEWLLAARSEEPTPRPPWLPEPIIPIARRRRTRKAETYQLLAVSNRLPDLRSATGPPGRNVGGLVSALEPALERRKGLWLGWSGRVCPGDTAGPVGLKEDGAPRLAWVDFPQSWIEEYYNGFSNRTLWPLFHGFPSKVQIREKSWETYSKVNDAFAAMVVDLVPPEATIWVHDYHLLLLARALRARGHKGPIGHFLHIPFPSADLLRILHSAEEVLESVLEYDLLGFQTQRDLENFRHAAGALPSTRVADDAVSYRDRRVRLGKFPIGIVPEQYEPVDADSSVEIRSLLEAIAPAKLILGVDRLDYSKGIVERLNAFGRLLEMRPELRGRVSLVQVSVPSRADIPDYAEQRSLVEAVVGRINGELGDGRWVPIRYLYRSYQRPQLAQLYRAADVGYVTPLRDGMNLVAKEFVAAQDAASPGVLVLSRFAGAAEELHDAVLTNPYHMEGMARDLARALDMPLDERRERHRKLRAVVERSTAVTWAEEFLRTLEACRVSR
jgi:alpha,alpha-trehalose-phosphate synthase [UDP-forming]/trehalose-phosphatase